MVDDLIEIWRLNTVGSTTFLELTNLCQITELNSFLYHQSCKMLSHSATLKHIIVSEEASDIHYFLNRNSENETDNTFGNLIISEKTCNEEIIEFALTFLEESLTVHERFLTLEKIPISIESVILVHRAEIQLALRILHFLDETFLRDQ